MLRPIGRLPEAEEARTLLDALRAHPVWLKLPHIDDPDATPSLAEDAVLLAAIAGEPLPLVGLPDPAPTSVERAGHRVSVDGFLLPSRALAVHAAHDGEAACGWLVSPARLLARVPDVLVRGDLPLLVREAFVAWLGADRADDRPEAALIRAAEAAATPSLRAAAIQQLMSIESRTLQTAGFVRERRAEIEVFLGMLLDDALAPPSPAVWLDHQARRCMRAMTAPDPCPEGGERFVVEALLESPFVGADVALLAERLRVQADRVRAPEDAPEGYQPVQGQARVDLRVVLERIADLPRPPAREMVERIRGVVDQIPDLPQGFVGPRPPAAVVALTAARAISDRGTWIADLNARSRSALVRWLADGILDEVRPLTAALYAERSAFTDQDRTELAIAVRRWSNGAFDRMDADLCLMAIACLPVLDPAEQEALIVSIAATPESWRLGLLRRLAEDTVVNTVRDAVVHLLLSLVTDPFSRALGGPAAGLLLALVREGRLPTHVFDEVLAALSPALRRHPRVSDELARAGRG
jgi:hypothetical protein